jgi:hypothetical protein
MENTPPAQLGEQGGSEDFEIPADPVERQARIDRGSRESRADYLRTIREFDEAMKELEKEKGILERLFGYRTSV